MSRYLNETTVKVTGNIKTETGKAILILVTAVNDIKIFPDDPYKSQSVWFPFSQVSSITRNPDKEDSIRVKEWLVLKTPALANALNNPGEASVQELDGNLAFKGTGGSRKREDDEGYERDPDEDIPF